MATTAYGGKAAVPAANLIVAGTSCKVRVRVRVRVSYPYPYP